MYCLTYTRYWFQFHTESTNIGMALSVTRTSMIISWVSVYELKSSISIGMTLIPIPCIVCVKIPGIGNSPYGCLSSISIGMNHQTSKAISVGISMNFSLVSALIWQSIGGTVIEYLISGSIALSHCAGS